MVFEEIYKSLIIYGPLGVFCVVALLFARQKDNAMTALQHDFLEKQEKLASEHKKEMQALEERLISKAETWTAKHYDLATSMQAVIAALQSKKE